ncbi:hypothetical protein IP92_05817 [Pseudoduganella flava]|uniref:Uncharacterized protein n=1 Tax=Pseudoduganella flava TaxID=871742 RepID=A0A562P960_9BURK|nr:hypothetical protein [Pseudoduganella flava]QGZ38059.1 hypothetical protein GO485_02675 [Pseudoduganella flava]TWI40997.1 hypothetical protein IP92_05817 [Pseudoduganella flava]
MHTPIAQPVTTAGFSFGRVARNVLAAIREAIKQYGAPYLNGPLPPL